MVRPEGYGSASVSLTLAPYFQTENRVKCTFTPRATFPGIFEVQCHAKCELESIVPGQEDDRPKDTADHCLLFHLIQCLLDFFLAPHH